MRSVASFTIGLLACGLIVGPVSSLAQGAPSHALGKASIETLTWQSLPALGALSSEQDAEVDTTAVTESESAMTNLAATQRIDGVEVFSVASGEVLITPNATSPFDTSSLAIHTHTGAIRALDGLIELSELNDDISLNVLNLVARGDVLIPSVRVNGVPAGPIHIDWSATPGSSDFGRQISVTGPVKRTLVNALGLVILDETLAFSGTLTFGTDTDGSGAPRPLDRNHLVVAELRGHLSGGLLSPDFNVVMDIGQLRLASVP